MELSELKVIIDKALRLCQCKLNEQPTIVLSESDFERLLSWRIMKELNQNNYKKHQPTDYTVHTQITHYKDGIIKHNRRPDIILLTDEGLRNANTPKAFIYTEESFALELKYIRANDTDYLRKVKEDFRKRKEIYNKSWLYVVVLIESESNKDYVDKKSKIESAARKIHEYNTNLFCFVMRKKKVDYDIIR
jgi:hypothetical protein